MKLCDRVTMAIEHYYERNGKPPWGVAFGPFFRLQVMDETDDFRRFGPTVNGAPTPETFMGLPVTEDRDLQTFKLLDSAPRGEQ